jgi:hypothetical protein
MDNIVLFGVPAVGLIVGLVQAFKAMGMADKFAPWAALGLSAAFGVLAQVLVSFPEAGPYISTLVVSVVLFLTASGAYTVGKNVKENVAGK